MRFAAACAAALLASAGCGQSESDADSGVPRDPVRLILDPHKRECGIQLPSKSHPGDNIVHGYHWGTPAKGEWPRAVMLHQRDRDKNPDVFVRFHDGPRDGVRVEIKFTAPVSRALRTLAFPHVNRAEGFILKAPGGDMEHTANVRLGDEWLVHRPASGEGTVTFVAWPHVH